MAGAQRDLLNPFRGGVSGDAGVHAVMSGRVNCVGRMNFPGRMNCDPYGTPFARNNFRVA